MCIKRFAWVVGLGCVCFTALQASAAVVTFDFGNANTANNSQNGGAGNWTPFANETTPVGTSASLTISGLEMTINGVANGGGDDTWGINNQGIGIHTDAGSGAGSRRLDGSLGEAISFSFDQDVTLTSIRLGSFGLAEEATVAISGGSTITIVSANEGPQNDFSLGGNAVSAGTLVTVTTSVPTGGGVLFNEITVDAIPEPGSLALLGLGGLLVLRRRRRVV